MFKKLSTLIFIALVLFVIWIYKEPVKKMYHRVATYSFCESPIKYKIGSVDPKFGISQKDFDIHSEAAADVWNSTYKSILFEKDPNASLTINLVYDERQSLTQEISEISTEVESNKNSLSSKIKEYDQRYEELKDRIDELNAEIEKWNEKGGAPSDEYERLKKEQQEISKEIESLNREGATLNKTTFDVNNKINTLNNTISMFNTVLQSKPEAGVYIPTENRIEIYSFGNKEQLVSTLAHEFGHALGLPHIPNQNTLMNAIATPQTTFTEYDRVLLEDFCMERDRVELLKNDLTQFINSYIDTYKKDR